MKIIRNDYDYNMLYEVDDLSSFDNDVTLDDFEKIKHKKVCFVDELFNLLIIELDKKEFFYKYNDIDILLLVSKNKLYEINWNGKFLNVLETSVDEYDVEMLDNIRKNDVIYFTTV